MKHFYVVTLALGLSSCGYKAAPSPAYGGKPERFSEEVERRKERTVVLPPPVIVTTTPTPAPSPTPTQGTKTKKKGTK